MLRDILVLCYLLWFKYYSLWFIALLLKLCLYCTLSHTITNKLWSKIVAPSLVGIWTLSQTSFSLYLHNQWTDFYKLSYAEKPQMRAIHTYVGYTKVTTNNWDIRLSVTVKYLFADISWMTRQICTIKLVLESAHQTVSDDI